VDVGVSAEGSSSLTLANTTITDTRLAVDAQTAPGELNLTGNVVAHNRQGVLQRGGSGAYVDNRVRDNAGAGLVLASGAHARLLGNAFGANGRGVVDAQPCGAPYSCGSVDAEGNAFSGNLGDGVAVNGTTTWRGDSFTANRGTGARLGSATLRDVVASGNDADGVEVRGMFTVRGSTFDHNGRHGATLVGGGDLRGSAFVFNVEAGIRLTSTQVTAYDLNVSRNFDGVLFDEPSAFSPFPVPPLPPASVQDVWALVGSVDPASPGPLDIHHSVLVGNERDAIRAGTAPVNATSNYWGSGTGPALSVADQLGAFRNGVGPTVRFVPWYEDAGLTTTGPVPVL
jgi:hypothetical protein